MWGVSFADIGAISSSTYDWFFFNTVVPGYARLAVSSRRLPRPAGASPRHDLMRRQRFGDLFFSLGLLWRKRSWIFDPICRLPTARRVSPVFALRRAAA